MEVDGAEGGGAEVIAPPWVRGIDAPQGTVWTPADALRPGDLVSIGDDAEDRSARIVATEPGGSPNRLRLRLAFALDGAALVQCSQEPMVRTRYLRRLPESRPPVVIPVTTFAGLESAWQIYDRAWDADGTVVVRLPVRVAGQLLHERGWVWPRGAGEADGAWTAPSGDRFSETSEAVQFALTAEYAECR